MAQEKKKHPISLLYPKTVQHPSYQNVPNVSGNKNYITALCEHQHNYTHMSLNFLLVNNHKLTYIQITFVWCILSPLSCFGSPPVEGGETQSLAPTHGNKMNHRPLSQILYNQLTAH